MPIRCVCPLGHPLVVADELAGSDGQCPVCQQRVAIPVADVIAAGSSVAGKVAEIQSVDRTVGLTLPSSTPPVHPPRSGDTFGSATSPFDFSPAAHVAPSATPLVAPPPLANQSRVYESRPEQIRAAYAISIVTGVLAFLGASPALVALGHPPVAGWVWIVILLSAIEVAYALWLASLPDWSTLWVGMALCAGLAAIQALLLGLVMAMPVTRSLPLGLDDVRTSLGSWSACLMALHGGLAYAAGWISSRWRREYRKWKQAGSK